MGRSPLTEGIIPTDVSQPLLTLPVEGDAATFN